MSHLVKHCIEKGCSRYPAFGFGLPSKDAMRWACSAHKDKIGFGVKHPAPIEAGRSAAAGPHRPASPQPQQGRLL